MFLSAPSVSTVSLCKCSLDKHFMVRIKETKRRQSCSVWNLRLQPGLQVFSLDPSTQLTILQWPCQVIFGISAVTKRHCSLWEWKVSNQRAQNKNTPHRESCNKLSIIIRHNLTRLCFREHKSPGWFLLSFRKYIRIGGKGCKKERKLHFFSLWYVSRPLTKTYYNVDQWFSTVLGCFYFESFLHDEWNAKVLRIWR